MQLNTQIYNNAIDFALIMINKNNCNSNVCKFDIVHNVIVNSTVSESNYKSLIISEIKKVKTKKAEVCFTVYEYQLSDNIDDSRVCRLCGETHTNYAFLAGFNNVTGVQQYRNVCTLCFKDVRKTYHKKQLTAEQKEKYKLTRNKWKEEQRLLYGKVPDATRNERAKRYWAKQKETLGDAYILKMLKAKNKRRQQFTPQDILNKRHLLITKKITTKCNNATKAIA